MGRRVDSCSKRKQNENKKFYKFSYSYKPEAKWSNNEQVERFTWKTEPVSVAKLWDDLLLGVKG